MLASWRDFNHHRLNVVSQVVLVHIIWRPIVRVLAHAPVRGGYPPRQT